VGARCASSRWADTSVAIAPQRRQQPPQGFRQKRRLLQEITLRVAYHSIIHGAIDVALEGFGGELAVFQARFSGLDMGLATHCRNLRARIAETNERIGRPYDLDRIVLHLA